MQGTLHKVGNVTTVKICINVYQFIVLLLSLH